MIDSRICNLCPLGDKPLEHAACRRCAVDVDAVELRKRLLGQYRDKFTYEDVDYTDALMYDVLPNLLPRGDPACV